MAEPVPGDRFVYTINGVKVVFPCKAYPTQLSMMNMVSTSLAFYGLVSNILLAYLSEIVLSQKKAVSAPAVSLSAHRRT